MAKTKKKEYNPNKIRSKIRRETQEPYGKAGPHEGKKEKRQPHMDTHDWLDEVEDDSPDWIDCGPGEILWEDEESSEEVGEDSEDTIKGS